METTNFIFDFDSTFIQTEALDELAEIVLADNPQKESIVQKVKEITKAGMEGRISFTDSLHQRIELLSIDRTSIEKLIHVLKKKVSASIDRNKAFFRQYHDQVYIVSGGFKEYIVPVVKLFGIEEHHVLANTFLFKGNKVTGYDRKNVLAGPDGKKKTIESLHLKGKTYVIGDGFTDASIKMGGAADTFFAFIENVQRDAAIKKADHILPNLDEFLYLNNLPRKLSYPKNRIRVFLLNNIDPYAAETFRKEEFQVESMNKTTDDQLRQIFREASIVGVRTSTKIPADLLKEAKHMLAIGAYCVGVDHIDFKTAARQGIAVFNAPYSNTRSVVELAMGEIMMLFRNVISKHMALQKGIWDKSAARCYEIRGKKLGIVGYGNIGSQLSILAEQLGMEVYYFDLMDRLPMGNAKRCRSLKELLKKADVVSMHVDGARINKHIISTRELNLMKDGALIVNMSRGLVVDLDALAEAIRSGKIGGAAVDVFPNEPKGTHQTFESPLIGLPNVILTPHIGGSTLEAQRNIAEFVTDKLITYINTGATTMSVNFPNLRLPEVKKGHRFIHIHHNVPGVLAQINSIMAMQEINIIGQYLGTNADIGYVITDVNKTYNEAALDELRNIPETIRLRVLY